MPSTSLNRTSRVCGIHVVGDQAGMAITAIQCTVQATSNSGIGSIRTRCLSPRNARSDMAVSRQVPTPVHYRGDAASWMRGSHLTITSPIPMNA